MERLTDTTINGSVRLGAPGQGRMLAEADRLNRQALGYPLNLMCSLYYETGTEEPFRHPAGMAPHNSEDSDE